MAEPQLLASVYHAILSRLVAEGRRLNDASGRRVPAGADAWLGRLGAAPALPDLPARFLPLPEEEEQRALGSSSELHELPMLRGWLADEEFLRSLALRLDEIAASPLYVDERQRAEQAARTIADAAESYLDEPRRQRLATRLLAVAAHLEALGDPAHARQAGAVARGLRAGLPSARVPFARMLVEKALPGRAAPEAAAPGEPPPGAPLIVAPGR